MMLIMSGNDGPIDFELTAESRVAEKHCSQRVILGDSRTARTDIESRIQMDIYEL